MAAIRFLALLLLLLPATAAAAAERPERIVSMNLCTDQLLMLLVDRARIASVSYLSAEPRSSVLAAQTRGLHLNHGLAEEILPLRPDLVIAGTFTTRPTVFLLRKLGYPVVDMPVANGLDDIRANIRRLAAAVGETARGDGMIADFDARLADTVPPPGRRRGGARSPAPSSPRRAFAISATRSGSPAPGSCRSKRCWRPRPRF